MKMNDTIEIDIYRYVRYVFIENIELGRVGDSLVTHKNAVSNADLNFEFLDREKFLGL